MRASRGLGVSITPDLVNDFFSLKPKSQQLPLKYQKHQPGGGTSNMTMSCTTGGVTPGNAFNINDVQYFEQQFKTANYDDEPAPKSEDINDLLQPEPLDDEEYLASLPQELSTEVYDNYSFAHVYDSTLPITEEQERIVQTIEANRVTIIQGSTGSGKTTQVPQYILDHYQQKRKFCNILVTQPRRIAAMSVAKRVSQERNWPIKTLIGYQIQLQNEVSEDTRITYLTTGVLLQKIMKNKHLNDYTHVILDEIHERDQDIDFAMLIVRYYLKTVSRHVKVILMSATADCTLFSNYFAMMINNRKEGAPIISVEGKMYDVLEYYFEDLKGLSEIPMQNYERPDIDEKCYKLCRELILALDKDELKEDYQQGRIAEYRGSVLVFLPGRREIETMHSYLEELITKMKLKIMVLHSEITNNVQTEVFVPSKKGERKVILSTNIAESSITVPDVKYVIDFCLTKQAEVDRDTKYSRLVLKWASKASLTQRKGRAGRVSEGHCFRLISHYFFDELDDHSEPEMQRASLEQLILKVKLLDLGPPPSMVLQLAIQPPRVSDIKKTILMLKEVGALTLYQNGKMNPLDGDLTFVGRVLGKLPVEIHLGKLLLIGYACGVLEECLIIASCLSLKSMFTKGFRDELNAYRNKMDWANNSSCDMIAALIAFTTWKYRKYEIGFGEAREQNWAKRCGLDHKRFKEIDDLSEKLRRHLEEFNMVGHRNICRREQWVNQKMTIDKDDELILKVVITGAFYPNYFQSVLPDETEAAKTMSGQNPCTTVVCHGAPPTLYHYRQHVMRLFRVCGNGRRLHFENTRCFIEFDPEPRLRVAPAVLIALKMRQLRMPINILVSKRQNDAYLREKALEINHPETGMRTNRLHTDLNDLGGKVSVTLNSKQVKLIEDLYIGVVVQHLVSPSHFWATYSDRDSIDRMANMSKKLNLMAGKNLPVLDGSLVKIGNLCCAPYLDEFFRATIKAIDHRCVEVFFVDFGNADTIYNRSELRKCPDDLAEIPHQAFECHLSEVRPIQGTWSNAAMEFINGIIPVGSEECRGKVYSVVHNAYRLELFVTQECINVNRWLIKEHHATAMEEPLLSKTYHEDREKLAGSTAARPAAKAINIQDCPASADDEEVTRIALRGPFSPYEMVFNGMTAQARLKASRVEMDSVNSVLVNDEPQETHSRFLVAASMSVNPNGNSFTARDTCLLPNIHGIGSLLTFLFAPEAELRQDKKETYITGALCGLGSEKTSMNRRQGRDGVPGILPDDEIEVSFDTKFTEKDLLLTNQIRYLINEIIGTDREAIEWAPQKITNYQGKVQTMLRKLVIDVPREDQEPVYCPREYRWRLIPDENLLDTGHDAKPTHLYVYHKGVFFSEVEDIDPRIKEKRASLNEFHLKAGDSLTPFPSEVVCPVCKVVCRHPTGLYLHCETRAHTAWVKSIFCDPGDEDE